VKERVYVGAIAIGVSLLFGNYCRKRMSQSRKERRELEDIGNSWVLVIYLAQLL
jgi:hypothetical protein